jgi:hypothetical protein
MSKLSPARLATVLIAAFVLALVFGAVQVALAVLVLGLVTAIASKVTR